MNYTPYWRRGSGRLMITWLKVRMWAPGGGDGGYAMVGLVHTTKCVAVVAFLN